MKNVKNGPFYILHLQFCIFHLISLTSSTIIPNTRVMANTPLAAWSLRVLIKMVKRTALAMRAMLVSPVKKLRFYISSIQNSLRVTLLG